ncbi:phosphatidylglycerophosphatase A [Cognatishimia sp.]|uniref:phosphatidylglycerophosphatase A family protein n=1 Tax=Cognatishimia sp. TaxID=2211648 RepID=UPI0035148730|nr:phosphatidylglycerophosphatase A [Cognatishimia sp.]
MSKLIATVFYVGYLRPAPGTWGSLAGVLFALAIQVFGGFPALVLATLIVFALGWWATHAMTTGTDNHDPSEVVVDEVVGQWIALFVVSYGTWKMGLPALAMYPGWIAGFLFFRLFDIWKPSIVGWADRGGDALGVMLDDVFAGVFAAIAVTILGGLYHMVIL